MNKIIEDNKIPFRSGDLLDRLASLLSYLLHPAILMILTVVLFSTWTRGSPAWVVIDVAILILGLLPGLL